MAAVGDAGLGVSTADVALAKGGSDVKEADAPAL